MIRAVLDTNVLASGILGFAAADRAPGRILRLWRDQRFVLIISADILAELLDTLAKPYFQRQLDPEQRAAAQLLLETEAVSTPVTTQVSGVATHPKDDLVLAAAVSARVDYFVTGDKPLQRLSAYRGIRILAPREFLDLLQATGDEES